MIRKSILLPIAFLFALSMTAYTQKKALKQADDRKLWLEYMDRLARPVISNLAAGQLKQNMTVVLSPKIDNKESRTKAAYLEAFARTLCGISPWLNLEGGSPEEVTLRNQYREWTLKAITHAVDPASKDYLTWVGGQPLVDASFFALALVRCPWLWEHSDETTKRNIVTALQSTRVTVPVYTNWILFTGMIEAFFCKYGFDYDKVRVEYAFREFAHHWYVGDGMYSDGMDFAYDYYNSYVIQPYLANLLDALGEKSKPYDWYRPRLDKITKRYAEIQERMIHSDGSFPVTGRSITYRGGAFHHLADMALRKNLPASLSPAQVRSALTAVVKKTLDAPGTFTKEGFLNIGLYGSQPELADFYINTGSVYLAAAIFLPLGLPASDEFWSAPAQPWTSLKVWSGQDMPGDHAMHLDH